MPRTPAGQVGADYSFGNWVKRRRKALDLTQQELSRRVGCSLSLIFKIESDERRPSRQIAELLAQHLEIPSGQRELFLKVARQEKATGELDSVSLPARPESASVSQPDLRIPLTCLIGREHEVSAIIRQLEDPICRLLTLAVVHRQNGRTEFALELAFSVFQHPASPPATKHRVEKMIAELEMQSTPASVEAIRARSQTRTLEELVSENLAL